MIRIWKFRKAMGAISRPVAARGSAEGRRGQTPARS